MVPVEIISHPGKESHLCRISVCVLQKGSRDRLNGLTPGIEADQIKQLIIYQAHLVIMVKTVADARIDGMFIGREVLVQEVGVIALLYCVILFIAHPRVHLVVSHALNPAQRHIVAGAQHAPKLGEGLTAFSADIYPVSVVPCVGIASSVVKLPAEPLFLHIFDTCPECKLWAQIVPSVHEAVLSYVRFITESVAVVVAGPRLCLAVAEYHSAPVLVEFHRSICVGLESACIAYKTVNKYQFAGSRFLVFDIDLAGDRLIPVAYRGCAF